MTGKVLLEPEEGEPELLEGALEDTGELEEVLEFGLEPELVLEFEFVVPASEETSEVSELSALLPRFESSLESGVLVSPEDDDELTEESSPPDLGEPPQPTSVASIQLQTNKVSQRCFVFICYPPFFSKQWVSWVILRFYTILYNFPCSLLFLLPVPGWKQDVSYFIEIVLSPRIFCIHYKGSGKESTGMDVR